MVSYCISLKSAQSDKEREKIFIEMRQEPHLKAILKQLEGDDDEGGSEDEDSNKRNGHASQQVLATTQYIFCGSVVSINSIWLWNVPENFIRKDPVQSELET